MTLSAKSSLIIGENKCSVQRISTSQTGLVSRFFFDLKTSGFLSFLLFRLVLIVFSLLKTLDNHNIEWLNKFIEFYGMHSMLFVVKFDQLFKAFVLDCLKIKRFSMSVKH